MQDLTLFACARNLEKNPHYAATTPGTGTGNGGAQGGPNAVPQENFLYYYHPDHLGSSSYVTDANGKPYEHLEYFPFGETWVEESSNTQRTPYLFTGKELDEETGLYYFGARYYDPRTSVWQSPDPILAKYLPTGNKEKDRSLAGMGGVFNSFNLNLYKYASQNPLKITDPDGNEDVIEAPTPNIQATTSSLNHKQLITAGAVLGGLRARLALVLAPPVQQVFAV